MTPRLRAAGRKGAAFRRNWAAFFRRAPLRPQAQPLHGSRPVADLAQGLAHGQRLAEACVTLRKPVEDGLSLLRRPTVLLRYFPRRATGYHDKPAVNELAMSIADESHRCRRMDREGRAQFSGNERRRTPLSRAGPDELRIPLLTLLLS